MLDFLYVGIGQCGNKFVDAFAKSKNVTAVAINTTQKDMNCLQHINAQNLIAIPASGTKGGAGKDIGTGKHAMQEHIEDVIGRLKNLGNNADYIFLWAGLGGGTGSGGLPILLDKVRTAMPEKKLVIGLTLPDYSEDLKVQTNAFNAFLEAAKLCEGMKVPFILVDNNKIKTKIEQVNACDWNVVTRNIGNDITKFFKVANQDSPYSTFDEGDLRNSMSRPGMMTIIKTELPVNEIQNENSLRDAILADWKDNFYVDFNTADADSLVFVVEAPDKYLKNSSNKKLLDASLEKLKGTSEHLMYQYTAFYPYNPDKNDNRDGKVIVYSMMAGLKGMNEQLHAMFAEAKKRSDAMKEKLNASKIDFDSFNFIDEDFDSDSPAGNSASGLAPIEDVDGGHNRFGF